ncbi:hypothetical protein [Roseateles violae]|uniref:Uncharacterized protein n=1 Tax=Roseateles violae TaxID=3058042 RepID=A0ABT8DTU0_9BURK|nr:hypothetical protein [Pelomonas sp. PFR6]MDN3921710.1 hypothetical protein [Pelomonas sp. PFR6]
MADSSSGSTGGFPWASVAVLAAFVASTQLVPRAFEALRPPEKERAQATMVEAALPIDARLWEDPFIALRRYEAERNDRCEKSFKDAAAVQGCKGADAQRQLPTHVVRRMGGGTDAEDTLVLAAMVPGNPFVGAEESRRRTRYAVLAGLQATGFLPDDAEHLGLLALPRKSLVSVGDSQPESTYNVPYELLHRDPSGQLSGEQTEFLRYGRVLLLWVDENALPTPKLDAMALLVTQLLGEWACQVAAETTQGGYRADSLPGLAVIGPSSTDALRVALTDLGRANDIAASYRGYTKQGGCLAADVHAAKRPNDLQLGYWRLSKAYFFNPFSTALSSYLPELQNQTIWQFLFKQFNEVVEPVFGPVREEDISFVRTISTDDLLIDKLVIELQRRLPEERRRRIVLIAERDSLYAQSLVRELTVVLKRQMPWLEVVAAYYFRGIDGVTTREAATAAAAVAKPGKDPQDESRKIEWPESRDQLDYLRRMALSLQQSESDPDQAPIGALGIFGFDVHDKLLVMQALHDNFADRIFMTTDMDARLLHPRALPFTRNLIVATSLPLEMPSRARTRPLDLRAGGAPFRDVYQSATYLAARQAGCKSDRCRDVEREKADDLIDNPWLYEIGRTRPIWLEGRGGVALNVGRADQGQGLVAGILLGFMSVALLLWPSTPSLRKLRARLVRFDPADAEAKSRLGPATALLATAQLAVLAFMYVTVLEFLNPRGLALWQPVALAMLVLAPASLAVWLDRRRERSGAAVPKLAAAPYYLLVLGSALVLMLLVWTQQGTGACDNCEPVAWFEGVSAWPSHLLHLLALVVIVGSIDVAWEHGVHTLSQDGHWLALGDDPESGRQRPGWLASLPRISLLRWTRPAGFSCDIASLWREYVLRAAGRPRALRVLMIYLLTMGIGLWLLWMLGTGQSGWGDSRILEIPVRGARHRAVVFSALALVLALLPLAILAVSDATLLVYRFVSHLNCGRSVYPRSCLKRFADALGDPACAELWCTPIAAEPERRSDGTAPARHSLLDGWIDMQLVARRTEHISPMVIGPFTVLGIVLLARSRVFDNWSLTPAIALIASAYLLVLIALGALLKRAVERTREHTLAAMAADLRWLKGQSGPMGALAKPFESLRDEVRTMHSGAFAGLFDQPMLKAMLVPLGGAGGAQLLDYLSLAW